MKRCRHDITFTILQTATEGEFGTNIMYAARLSWTQLEKYLEMLREKGFIEKRDRRWFTTKKGFRFIQVFESLPAAP